MMASATANKPLGALSKLFKGVMGFLDIFSCVLGIVEYIEMKADTDMEKVKESLQEIQRKLDSIKEDLEKLVITTKDEGTKTRYFHSEKAIRGSVFLLRAYANTRDPKEKDNFLALSQSLSTELRTLYDGLNNTTTFGGDLLRIAREGTKVYGKDQTGNFQKVVEPYIALVNIGLLMFFCSLQMRKAEEKTITYWKSEFQQLNDQFFERYSVFLREGRDRNNLRDEIGHVLRHHQSESNLDVSKKLYDFLANKYDTDYWMVVVYDGITGFDVHCISGWFTTVFREGNKNAAVISISPGAAATKVGSSALSAATEGIEAFCRSQSPVAHSNSRWRYPLTHTADKGLHYKAEAAYDELYQSGAMACNVALAVIDASANAQVSSHDTLQYFNRLYAKSVRAVYPFYYEDGKIGLQLLAIEL